MSSLRLALKQSLEESGIVPAKMARDKERKRMEVEYRKKKLKQQQQQQQRRKPGDPPRKRGRPPKNRPPQEPPATQSEHNDVNDNHDDDSSEVEATFSSDEGFVGHEGSDSHREESSHHSDNNNSQDGKREAENEDPVPIAMASTPANKVAAFPPKVTAVVPVKPDFDDDEEEDEGYRNQDGEDVDDDEEESQSSEKAARKKLQRKQESAANMIKRGWKKKKGIVDKRENHMISSSSSTSSSVEPPVASAVPEEPEEAKNSSLPPPPSVKKIPKEPPMERNKKDSNTQKAKTVPAPSKELIEWMRTLPKKKMKRNVAPGLRVKVRFAARIKRDGKSIRKLKWYGGVVAKVGKDGSKIRIKYDDGTSEISPFPDPDIIVDDESNGQHECEADWFIPDPMDVNPDETPSSPRVEKKLKRPSETSEPYEEQQSITSPPVRPPKKMKRSMPLVKNEEGEIESNVMPSATSSESTANNPSDPVEPRKIKKKHHHNHVVEAKRGIVEEPLSETQQIVDEPPSQPPVQEDVASEVVSPASVIVTDTANSADIEENPKSWELTPPVSESVEPESMQLESKNVPFEASPMDESESVTVSGMTTTETTKSDIDMAVTATTQPVKDLEPSSASEAEAPKLPMLTIRLSKHAPSPAEEVLDDEKVVSPGKSQSSDSVPFTNDESGEDDDEEEDELAVERSSDAAPPVAQEEVTRAISVDADAEKEKRPSKRIYIKLDMDSVERNSATIEEEPTCGEAEDGDSQQNVTTEPSESTLGEKVDAALVTTVVPGVDDTDASSPPPMDDHVKVPAAVVSLSAKRHGKGVDRLDEVIKPRRLTPIRPTESPTPLSCEPLNVVAETEFPKPFSTSSDAIDIERHARVVSDEVSVKKVPILTSSKNSAFSKKESSLSKKEAANSPVPSKAALRITMRELATGDDDESTDVAAPKQRGSKSTSAPRAGRRAAQQANQRISAKQEALQEAIAKKKRKRDKTEGRKREDGDESESSEDDRQWVQCDNCRKWRLLPTKIEPSMLPKLWYCEMNSYDPKRSSCVAPEQTAAEYAKEKKRAKKRFRQRIESPEEAEENATEEPTERREPKAESNKRILVRSPIPVKEKDHSLKASSKSEQEPENKAKRSSPDSNILGCRSPIPERETESQKGEKRLPGLSAKKSRIAEAEAASSSDGALEVVKVRGRGRGRARIAKELDKDQEKPVGAKPSSQDTNEADNVEWVQCEKCDKWRKLPPHIAADDLPDVWYCSMNTWNTSSASCEAAEDKADGYTHELSIFGGSPSTNSNKLSYRNLIFGTGKKFNRPISERTRAMESLFAVPADDNDGYPTVMYANSCAFVPRAGLRGTTDSNNGNSANISFLDLMKHSSLWAELRGVGEKMNNYSFGNFGHQYQRRTSFESFTDEMKQSMKELVCQSLGSRTLAGHEVLLEAQCRQWENVPPAWAELRPYCTVEIVVSALVDLVKDGVVELVEEPGADRTSKDWIPRYRCAHLKSAEPAPVLADEGTRVSRCIKISKPWKHAQANNQWMLYS